MTARTVLVLAASLEEEASGSAGEFIDEILWDVCASTRRGRSVRGTAGSRPVTLRRRPLTTGSGRKTSPHACPTARPPPAPTLWRGESESQRCPRASLSSRYQRRRAERGRPALGIRPAPVRSRVYSGRSSCAHHRLVPATWGLRFRSRPPRRSGNPAVRATRPDRPAKRRAPVAAINRRAAWRGRGCGTGQDRMQEAQPRALWLV